MTSTEVGYDGTSAGVGRGGRGEEPGQTRALHQARALSLSLFSLSLFFVSLSSLSLCLSVSLSVSLLSLSSLLSSLSLPDLSCLSSFPHRSSSHPTRSLLTFLPPSPSSPPPPLTPFHPLCSGAGIVLPDESYYEIEYNGTKLGDDRAQDREYLRSYYVKINQLAGSTKDEAEVLANKTLEVETRIAQWRLVSRPDPLSFCKPPFLCQTPFVFQFKPPLFHAHCAVRRRAPALQARVALRFVGLCTHPTYPHPQNPMTLKPKP
eukprot:2923070-Rhodomonas_salina.2